MKKCCTAHKILFVAVVMFLCSQVYLQAQVSNSAEEIRPLLVGTKIPAAKLITSDGEPLDLNETVKKKPAVLMFYRGGWCGYSNTQMSQLKEIERSLTALKSNLPRLPRCSELHELCFV